MQPGLRQAKRVNKLLFFGSLILVLFFIVAVKFRMSTTYLMEGEPLPPLSGLSWVTPPLTEEGLGGKPLLTFFYRDGVEVSQTLFKAALKTQEEYGDRGLITLMVVSTKEDENRARFTSAKGLPEGFHIARESGNFTRKRLNHSSFAFYYLADRMSVIKKVGTINSGPEKLNKTVESLL